MKEGFTVLVYTSDDPILAKRLKAAGAASVMPAGSPIGSGQGILNPNNIRICLEYLKEGDPDYPVIVDAGVGTASDVSAAMELGCDGVLLNTAIAAAKDPLRMAWAMRYACDAGRLAYLAGRIPKKLYANASSPTEGYDSREQMRTCFQPSGGNADAIHCSPRAASPYRKPTYSSSMRFGITRRPADRGGLRGERVRRE